jgi:hypothetical protein
MDNNRITNYLFILVYKIGRGVNKNERIGRTPKSPKGRTPKSPKGDFKTQYLKEPNHQQINPSIHQPIN